MTNLPHTGRTIHVRRAFPVLAAMLLLFPLPSATNAQDLTTALMEATFRISGPMEESSATAAGTVFFLSRPVKAGKPATVMVTAAHVLTSIAGDHAVLLLRKRTADGELRSYEHPVRIRERNVPLWRSHPDADADVAVLPLELPAEAHVSRVTVDLLATDEVFSRYEIHTGDELLSLGYPFGLPANSAGFPILRSGKIASYPLIPAKKHRSFLYDVQAHSGNSGGPVYFTASSRTYGGSHKVREIGFIAGLVITQAVVEGRSLDLAAVIPAQFIREAIEALPLAGGPR